MNKISQTVPYQVDTIFSPFKAEEFNDALAFLQRDGFTGVELAIAYPDRVDADALNAALEAHALVATTISTGQIYGLEGLYLSAFDADIRARAAEVIKGHIALSARIGLPPVTVGLIRGKLEEGDKAALLENMKAALLPCVDYAQKLGVTLQVEPINHQETVLLNSTYETLDFIHALGGPENVGILYDTYHSNIEDNGMAAAIKAAGKRVMNVHLADSHRGLPGYGDIDFMAVVSALREVGYRGAFALETLIIPDKEFVCLHGLESVKAILANQ